MHRIGVFDYLQMRRRLAEITELVDRGGRIVEQALPESGVAPGLRDHSGTALGAYFFAVSLDPGIDGLRVDQAFVDQQRFQRLDAQGRLRRQMTMQVLMYLGNFFGVKIGH